LPEPKRKARPTPDAVITDLFKLLPEYVNDAIKATLYFGFRKGEVFSLQIHNVDFDAGGVRLEHDHVKDDEDAFLPGGRDAMQFLARLVDQAKERGVKHLITYRVKRKDPADQAAEPWRSVKNPRGCWRRAMKVIEETHGKKWRWHDLRAAFITQVALTSGPIAAQALARHSDFETTQGYIEVADDVTRAAAEKASQRPAFGGVRGGKT
jgi:integrase